MFPWYEGARTRAEKHCCHRGIRNDSTPPLQGCAPLLSWTGTKADLCSPGPSPSHGDSTVRSETNTPPPPAPHPIPADDRQGIKSPYPWDHCGRAGPRSGGCLGVKGDRRVDSGACSCNVCLAEGHFGGVEGRRRGVRAEYRSRCCGVCANIRGPDVVLGQGVG